MKAGILGVVATLTLALPLTVAKPAAAAINPQQLGLGASAYPAGAVITRSAVDKTAAAVSAEGILGTKDTHGTVYQKLHFSGSIFQHAVLPRFNGAARTVWLMATIFPTSDAANQAYGSDSSFSTTCDSSPAPAVSIPTQTCSYINTDGSESGMYVVGVEHNIEFIVLAFVETAGPSARDRAVRDALYVSQEEAAHLAHVLAIPPQGSTSTTPSRPAATATVTPPSTPTPTPSSSKTTHTTKPASSNKRCPDVLHNRGWSKVSLRPDLYIGCVVDIATQVYQTQTLNQSVEYNSNMNPDNGPTWTVFLMDYSDNPPSIADNSWVHVQGTIEDSASAYSSFGGSFVGNVPQVKISHIAVITAAQAKKMGADATK